MSQSVVVCFVVALLPVIGLSMAFRKRAKERGHAIRWFRPIKKNSSNPFLDQRLSDAYRLVRNCSVIGGSAMLAIAIVGGIALEFWDLYWMALSISIVFSSLRTLFLEGAIAFGAELTPVAPPSLDDLDAARTA